MSTVTSVADVDATNMYVDERRSRRTTPSLPPAVMIPNCDLVGTRTMLSQESEFDLTHCCLQFFGTSCTPSFGNSALVDFLLRNERNGPLERKVKDILDLGQSLFRGVEFVFCPTMLSAYFSLGARFGHETDFPSLESADVLNPSAMIITDYVDYDPSDGKDIELDQNPHDLSSSLIPAYPLTSHSPNLYEETLGHPGYEMNFSYFRVPISRGPIRGYESPHHASEVKAFSKLLGRDFYASCTVDPKVVGHLTGNFNILTMFAEIGHVIGLAPLYASVMSENGNGMIERSRIVWRSLIASFQRSLLWMEVQRVRNSGWQLEDEVTLFYYLSLAVSKNTVVGRIYSRCQLVNNVRFDGMDTFEDGYQCYEDFYRDGRSHVPLSVQMMTWNYVGQICRREASDWVSDYISRVKRFGKSLLFLKSLLQHSLSDLRPFFPSCSETSIFKYLCDKTSEDSVGIISDFLKTEPLIIVVPHRAYHGSELSAPVSPGRPNAFERIYCDTFDRMMSALGTDLRWNPLLRSQGTGREEDVMDWLLTNTLTIFEGQPTFTIEGMRDVSPEVRQIMTLRYVNFPVIIGLFDSLVSRLVDVNEGSVSQIVHMLLCSYFYTSDPFDDYPLTTKWGIDVPDFQLIRTPTDFRCLEFITEFGRKCGVDVTSKTYRDLLLKTSNTRSNDICSLTYWESICKECGMEPIGKADLKRHPQTYYNMDLISEPYVPGTESSYVGRNGVSSVGVDDGVILSNRLPITTAVILDIFHAFSPMCARRMGVLNAPNSMRTVPITTASQQDVLRARSFMAF